MPKLDRGRGDPRNILGVIIKRDEDKDQYKIVVKAHILKRLYSRNQFDLCEQRLLTETYLHQENSVSLSTAVNTESTYGGHGLTNM